jgi:hypothetical protein
MEVYGKAEGITYLEARRRWAKVKKATEKKQEVQDAVRWRNLSP